MRANRNHEAARDRAPVARPGPALRRTCQILFFAWFAVLLAEPASTFFRLDPLTAAITGISARRAAWWMLWSLLILIPTLFLGRFFCGWICPVGSLHQFIGSAHWGQTKTRIARNRYKKWQTTKYGVLVAGVVAALLGCNAAGWIDPLSLLVRFASLSILPTAASRKVVAVYQPHYWLSLATCAGFVALLAMNLRIPRFWCRALCPLGALLGAASRWSLVELKKDESACNRCARCLMHCQGGDDPVGGARWHKTECHLCMNCVDACAQSSLQFGFVRGRPHADGPDLSRRATVATAVTGLAVVPVFHAERLLGLGRNDSLAVRPPGALEEKEFLSRCIRCGECMRACPTHALQPALTEAGLAGIWSPAVTPAIGYCEPGCVLCATVCPTGAIAPITQQQKGWLADSASPGSRVSIGVAVYDRGRCLPWATGTDCSICIEWCPVSPRAIVTEQADIADSSGKTRILGRPKIDADRCVGCGACEYACPLTPAAVRVRAVSELLNPGADALQWHFPQGNATLHDLKMARKF